MHTRIIATLLAFILLFALLGGCKKAQPAVQPDPTEPVTAPAPSAEPEIEAEPVTLRIAGPWEDFPAMETVATLLAEKYPNVTIDYEYIQDYYASVEKRLATGEDPIDLFVTTNIQDGSALLPYVLDLYSASEVDLSNTFDGLIRNFEFRSDNANAVKQIYAVPLGAEIRGMYVNKTLLGKFNLSVPKNCTELFEACRVLAENGFVPLQGNPGLFAQQFLYPYCCNLIANAADPKAAYDLVNSRAAGVGELFREPMSVMYSIVENNYYNYKYVENEFGMFTDTSNEAYARYFLNITGKDGVFEKADDVGTIAFMPLTMGAEGTIAKTKSDYHSSIDYEFILSPVGEDGGYAYMSPAHGIAVNKNSENLVWAERLISFLFEPAVSTAFAERHAIIPNTKDAFQQIEKRFSIPEDHISHLGEVTFDYGFYEQMSKSLVEVAKANNPKYMTTDASGNEALYPFDYFMENLEKRLTGTMPAE